MEKTYEDLSPEEENELVLWLSHLEHSVDNARLQIERWKQLKNFWDLEMLFVTTCFIDEAISGVKRIIKGHDLNFTNILEQFEGNFKTLKIKGLRNDIVHRQKISKFQDAKGKPLEGFILILSGYNANKDEYTFGKHNLKLSEVFDLIYTLDRDIRELLNKRLLDYYKTGNYAGMIPFTFSQKYRPNV